MALTKVTSAVIKDATITDADIGSTLTSAISGSTTALSSSVATRFDSRESDMTLATASIAAITASLGQPVNTDSNVTFNNINSTGTITAVEVHTTFVSSSIAVASGSNNFGDATDDHHSFTGSLSVSASLSVTGSATIDGAFTQDGGAVFNEDSANVDFRVESNGNANMLVVDGGEDMVFVGTANKISFDAFHSEIMMQMEAVGTAPYAGLGMVQNSNDTDSSVLIFGKSRGTSAASTTIVQDGDLIGRIEFQGMDGSDLETGASIVGEVDGTPGDNDMPGRLVFKTTADGADSATARMTIKSDGDVGIGTTSPESRLQVEGAVDTVYDADETDHQKNDASLTIRNTSNTDNSFAQLIFRQRTSGQSGARIVSVTGGTNDADLRFITENGNSLAERMRIGDDGRVGIGDASPGSPLDVKSSEAANTANFNSTNGATNITFESNGSLIGQMEFSGPGPSQIVTRTSASLALGSNNVKTLHITDDDRVGIGTDSPDTALVVAGAFQGNASDTILNTQGVHIDDTTAWSSLHANKPTGGGINFSGVYNSSNAQIIFGGIRGLKENNTDGNYDGALVFGTIANGGNMTEKMRIASTGKVGIGTDTPSEKLHVAGAGGTTLLIKVSDGNDAKMQFETSTTTYRMGANIGGVGNDTFSILDMEAGSGTERLRIKNDGEIDGNFNDTSDRAQKENIKDLTNTLEGVKALNPSTFNWIKEKVKGDKTKIGFIAQDVEAQFPELVDGKEGEKSISTIGLVSVLTKTVQELIKRIEELEN